MTEEDRLAQTDKTPDYVDGYAEAVRQQRPEVGSLAVGAPVYPPAFLEACGRTGGDVFLPYSYTEAVAIFEAGVDQGYGDGARHEQEAFDRGLQAGLQRANDPMWDRCRETAPWLDVKYYRCTLYVGHEGPHRLDRDRTWETGDRETWGAGGATTTVHLDNSTATFTPTGPIDPPYGSLVQHSYETGFEDGRRTSTQAGQEPPDIEAPQRSYGDVDAGWFFPGRTKIDALLEDGTHRYWSTHCRHGNHEACKAEVHLDTPVAVPRKPAQCKTCSAPCICDCHKENL